MKNLRFEIYFRFVRIQTYRIFYFLRKFFAKHQTLSSQCSIFCRRQITQNSALMNFKVFLFIVVIVISIFVKTTFSQISIHSQLLVKFYSDRTRKKPLLRRLKNIGMASEKLHRNTLKVGCLQILLKCNNTKVQEIKNCVTFVVGLVLILWNGLLFVQSIE